MVWFKLIREGRAGMMLCSSLDWTYIIVTVLKVMDG